jgi:hypothetical protein
MSQTVGAGGLTCPGRAADLALSLTFSGCVLGVELHVHAYARRSLSLLAAAPPSHSASTAIMASTWKRPLADYARWRLIHPAKDTSSSRKRETPILPSPASARTRAARPDIRTLRA